MKKATGESVAELTEYNYSIPSAISIEVAIWELDYQELNRTEKTPTLGVNLSYMK